MEIFNIRHDWPEKAGFTISRPQGHKQYTFLHFSTPVSITVRGELQKARPGACIFYTPGEPQWFYSSRDMIHNWMHTDGSLSERLDAYGIPKNQLLYPSQTGFISELFRKIELEHFSSNPHKETLIRNYTEEFLIMFSRAISGDIPENDINRSDRIKFRKIRQEVLSQSERKWTVAEMAELAALSPSRFHAVYKELFGTSPIQDVIEAKIRYAKSLLLSNEHLTLPEVAEKLGYHDQYHFLRQFKAATGMTPGVYRKRHR